MLSYRIEGAAFSAVFMCDEIEVIESIKFFFGAHQHTYEPDLRSPKVKAFIIEKHHSCKYTIRFNDTFKVCESLNNLLGVLTEYLYDNLPTDNFFYLHGGLVSKKNICVAFLAPSSMGKTTMVMGMLEHGYCYRSDDIIPICKTNSKALSFPKPIFLREDSTYRNLSNVTIRNGDYCRHVLFPNNIHYSPADLTAIFVLNREKEFTQTALLKRLYGVEKIKSILYNIYAVANSEEAISCVMKLLRSVPVYKLFYYTTNEAICLINKVVNDER